jgi:hypothetical protein
MSGQVRICQPQWHPAEGRDERVTPVDPIGNGLVAIGLLWPAISKLGLGRLPGDIVIRRDHVVFYAPITTCLIISVILSLIVWTFSR